MGRIARIYRRSMVFSLGLSTSSAVSYGGCELLVDGSAWEARICRGCTDKEFMDGLHGLMLGFRADARL